MAGDVTAAGTAIRRKARESAELVTRYIDGCAEEIDRCTRALAERLGHGGPLADLCEHAFVVPSWSIHRIQEVHTVLLHLLWDHTHVALGEPDVL